MSNKSNRACNDVRAPISSGIVPLRLLRLSNLVNKVWTNNQMDWRKKLTFQSRQKNYNWFQTNDPRHMDPPITSYRSFARIRHWLSCRKPLKLKINKEQQMSCQDKAHSKWFTCLVVVYHLWDLLHVLTLLKQKGEASENKSWRKRSKNC